MKFVDENFRGRTSNSINAHLFSKYIKKELKGYGYNVAQDNYLYIKKRKLYLGKNIYNRVRNTKKTLILGAHYDCDAKTSGLHDNASGVWLLLYIAKKFSEELSSKININLQFAFFSDEEKGKLGSKHFVNKVCNNMPIGFINLDSILAGDFCYIYGGKKTSTGVINLELFNIASSIIKKKHYNIKFNLGNNKEIPYPTTGNWGDHYYFNKKNIPTISFETTNWEIWPYDGSIETKNEGKIMHQAGKDTFDFLNNTGLLDKGIKNIELLYLVIVDIVSELGYKET